ncbi:hypothetical protein EI969_18305 [Pseudomonas sp. PB101]|uniref:hypothetical protein n=1 Tax=Pseudomonas sp. PB101 TaxID=2495428 RepID=UPI001365C38F|nr:hypothetical protein [Pseudomonas sp. PB101]MVW87872.1 hypothetical protein [Pseudomonas sp. PB101]
MFDLSSKTADQLLGWSNVGLVVGSILVLLATIGAMWATSVRDTYSEIRQSNNETAVVQASAASKAADARAEEAKRGSAEATLKAAEANERAAQLEQQTAELKKQAEEAKAEAAKVNERLHKLQATRQLTKDQIDQLSSLLKSDLFRAEPPANVRIFSVADTESQLYALNFLNLMRTSNVNFCPTPNGCLPGECVQLNETDEGVTFTVGSLETKPSTQRFVALHHLLLELNIPHLINVDPKLKDHEATITILQKPVV